MLCCAAAIPRRTPASRSVSAASLLLAGSSERTSGSRLRLYVAVPEPRDFRKIGQTCRPRNGYDARMKRIEQRLLTVLVFLTFGGGALTLHGQGVLPGKQIAMKKKAESARGRFRNCTRRQGCFGVRRVLSGHARPGAQKQVRGPGVLRCRSGDVDAERRFGQRRGPHRRRQ